MARHIFVTTIVVIWLAHSGKADECDTDRKHPNCHPMDPLSESEISEAASIIRKHQDARWVFISLTLKEPEKKSMLPYFNTATTPPPGTIHRKALAILVNRADNKAYDVTVDLDTDSIEIWNPIPYKIPTEFTFEEAKQAEDIIRNDPRIIERCAKQGFTNMSLITANTWSMGYVGDRPEFKGKRVVELFVFGKTFDLDNQFAHPFDFMPIVDLNEGKVTLIEELPSHDDYDANKKEGTNVPKESFNFREDLVKDTYRKDIRPLHVTQPTGASYKIKGHQVEWHNFKFRIGYDGRVGLILHYVTYTDKGTVRPLFYRMSLSEVFVPYGDPRPPYHRKNAYDGGEFGLGFGANTLNPGIDCLGHTEFIDFILHREDGTPWRVSRAVCIHEEDGGVLWKKSDLKSGYSSVVRSQKLDVMFATTIGNYDYIVKWTFYLDGSIEFTLTLTGVLTLSLMAENATPIGHGTTVHPRINAQYHQHFFNLRVDPEIDGNENSVSECEIVSMDEPTGSPKNPYGSGMTTKAKVYKTAEEGRSNVNPEKARIWHMKNLNKLNNHTKTPVAWKLMPWNTPKMLIKNDSPIHPRVEWLDYNVWVSPYQDGEFYPGGVYLNNSGLPEWVRNDKNANIDNTDIVVWHNVGVSHVPRVEDFPVMPAESIHVFLKPVNFFKGNPSLDVPPPKAN